MNWGSKIATLYIGFVVMIIGMVVLAMRQKVELVSPDYYAQELKFEEKLEKMRNSNTLEENITWRLQNDTIILNFPQKMKGKNVKGNLIFYCPSDAKKDIKLPVSLNADGKQHIAKSKLQKGTYNMQVEWEADKKIYFSEQSIAIP